jgi:predicted PurR-regulated permease PerM
MFSVSPALQRATLLGVSATAAIVVGGAAWYVVSALAPVIGLFFGGWLLGCVLEPCVDGVARLTRVRRSVAVLSTYAALLVMIALAWWVAAPIVARQFDTSLTRLSAGSDTASRQLVVVQSHVNAWLADHGVAEQFDLPAGLPIDGAIERLGLQMDSIGLRALGVANGALGAVGSLAIMLLLSVFFLIDGPRLADQIADAFGCRLAGDVRFVQTTVHDAFNSFLRVQLLQGILFAIAVWACLAVAQVDTAPLVGVAAGALLLIPVVGAVLAVFVPIVATVLWNPGATLPVSIALVLLEQIVLNVVGPRLMTRQLGLPPLLVFVGVLGGGQIAGLWGAVFGVPVLAASLACADYFWKRWSNGSRPNAATNVA